MLWIPYIPLIVFLLTLVPAFYYGFKIGWRASLLISLTTFFIIALAVLVFYFAYETIVWPWWKLIYISKNIKPGSGISSDLFIEIASIKKMGVLFASGCFAPIAILISWGIYRLVRRPLNKYLGHKTNEVQDTQNQKSIISLKNRKPSKIIGGVILIANTTLVAGMLTSTTNIIVVPRVKRNAFSKVTDGIGGIYGIGLAKNNEEGRIIHEFISKLDSKIAESISEFTNLSNKNKAKSSNLLDVDKLNTLITQKLIFGELFKNDNASYELFKAITKNINHSINPLKFFKSIVSDNTEHGNQIGFNSKEDFYTLDESQKWFEDNTKLIDSMNFPSRVRQLLLDVVKRNFEKFEDSVFFTNVEKAKAKLDIAKTNLENYEQKLISLLDKNKKDADRRAKLIQSLIPNLYGINHDNPGHAYQKYDIKDIMQNYSNGSTNINYEFKGNASISKGRKEIDNWFTPSPINENPSHIELKPGYSDESLTRTNAGIVHDKFINYINSKIQQEYDIAVFTHYQNELTAYIDGIWNDANELLNAEKHETSLLESNLRTLNSELRRHQSDKKHEEDALRDNRARLAKVGTEIENLNNLLIPTKEDQKRDAEVRERDAKSVLDTQEMDRNSKLTSFNDATDAHDRAENTMNDLADNLEKNEKSLKKESSHLSIIRGEISDLVDSEANLKNQIAQKKSEINSIESEINLLQKSTKDKSAQISELENKKRQLENEKVGLENRLREVSDNLEAKKEDKRRIDNKISDLESEINKLKTDLKTAEKVLESSNEELQNRKRAYDASDKKFIDANRRWIEAANNSRRVKEELDSLRTRLSSSESEKTNISNLIMTGERRIKNLEISIADRKREISQKTSELSQQRVEQANAQKDFDAKEKVRLAKENVKNKKLKIKKASVSKANTSWSILQENMAQLDSYMQELTNLNGSLKAQEESYKTLMTKDLHLKDRADATGLDGKENTSDLAFNDFRKDDDDTGAIYYHEQHIRFLNSKISQLEKIRNDREDQYHEARSRIIKMYQNWLKI